MYNYNKKINKNKIIDKKLEKKLNLLEFIYPLFPSTLLVSKNKEELKNGYHLKRVYKTYKTFLENEFVYYNEQVCNFIIIDIDHKKYSIFDYIMELKLHNAIPNWIIETNKGYQLGFILEKPFVMNKEFQSELDKKLINYSKFVQKCISYHFQGDENSLRLNGVFRNPVGQTNKELFFNISYKYNLNELDIYHLATKRKKPVGNPGGKFHKNDDTISEIKDIITKILNGEIEHLNNVKDGKRNSFIWYFGMYLSKNFTDWEEQLHFYNNNLINPLEEKEMESIMKSINRYNRIGSNKVNLGGYKTWTKKYRNIYINNYRKKKGIVKMSREEQKEFYTNKVVQAIYKLHRDNKKLTIKNISEVAGVSTPTVKRKLKELKEIPHFANLLKK